MATHSSTLAWKIPWMEEPGRLQSMGSLRVGQDWATSLSTFLSGIAEGNGNPLQCSCLKNPRDGGAWWAAVYGVAQSWTGLKWLSSSSSTRPSRTNTQRCPFHHRGLEWERRKSRDTWSNRQVWPWSTKWSRAKANRVLPREWTDHTKHPLPTTQETTLHMDITTYLNNEIRLIIFFAAEEREALYSQQKQDRELTMAQIMNSLLKKFRLKLKKVGKKTRPLRYDL